MGRPDLALEQKVLRVVKDIRLPQRALLALSGGVDSMVMAEILYKWRVGLGLELAVAYVHHGYAHNSEPQQRYRDRAGELVRDWATARELKFFTNDDRPQLVSEVEFRDFRDEMLRQWAKAAGCEIIAFAHHQDDLLETRLIRLIRGAGEQGLRAMSVLAQDKFRPLLALSRREIRGYAEVKGLTWLEDPSNDERDPLRNWLRQEWLPSLESKRPGALNALSRSLEMISPKRDESIVLGPYVGLRRELLQGVSSVEQKALLAQYLKSLGLKNYAQTHVDEILKRLKSERKNLSFDMLGMRFHVTRELLWAADGESSLSSDA